MRTATWASMVVRHEEGEARATTAPWGRSRRGEEGRVGVAEDGSSALTRVGEGEGGAALNCWFDEDGTEEIGRGVEVRRRSRRARGGDEGLQGGGEAVRQLGDDLAHGGWRRIGRSS